MKSKRSKACDIPMKVKLKVWERDGHKCIFCGSTCAFPDTHYISRPNGGLGIEENILTSCRKCHNRLDQGTAEQRLEMKWKAKEYLKSKYEDWNEEKLYYKKY